MASLKDLKRKISGVKNIQQITRAMKMMATAKLKKAMERLNSTRFYLEKLEQLVADLKEVVEDTSIHPLFGVRPVKCLGIVLVTGERGLCGSFNYDLIKQTLKYLRENEKIEKKLILIGKKGNDYFKRRNFQILGYHSEFSGPFTPARLNMIARDAISLFRNQIIDELMLIFMRFTSALSRKVIIKKLLPLKAIETSKVTRHNLLRPIQFDPSPEKILNALIPRYVEGLFLRAVLESSAAEQSARMIAMSGATDRAKELIDELGIQFNRSRQATITKEISEVVSGADALSD